MATNVTPFPRLPTPGQQIDTKYITDLVRALEVFLKQAQNPQLNFPEIPTDGNNHLLQQGDIFIADGGFLKVVLKTDIYAGTITATGSVGTVTVAVS